MAQASSGLPVVSVVIPTRDRAPIVRRAALDALGQDGVHLEVIIVDDCSRDQTEEAVHAIDDARVHYVRQDRRGGPGAARNRGIAEAKGEWIAFLDDDDRWRRDKLRRQLQVARVTGAEWVWSTARILDTAGELIRTDRAPPPSQIGAGLRSANIIPAGSSSVIATAASIRRLDGFDEQLAHLADWDMWIRLADSTPAAACDEPLVEQVRHPGGMHAVATKEALAEFELFRAKHPDVSARRYVNWITSAHRRAGRRWPAGRDWLVGRWRYRRTWNRALRAERVVEAPRKGAP